MKHILITYVSCLCIFLLMGCEPTKKESDIPAQTDNPPVFIAGLPAKDLVDEKDEKKDDSTIIAGELIKDDFIIRYKDILISDQMPFEELAQQLGLAIDSNMVIDANNIMIRAAGNERGFSYTWYRILYPHKEEIEYDDNVFFDPDKESTDMVIDYVVNETECKAWLVSIDLINSNAATYRNLKVGDEKQLFLENYDTDNTNAVTPNYYRLKLQGDDTMENPTRYCSLIFDNTTEKVLEISLDYGSNETMDYLGIVAFD